MVVDVAKTYVCDACAKYKKPHQSSPASYKSAEHFNQMVQADVFWIKGANHKYPILAVIDVATRFQTAAVIHHEKSADFIAAMFFFALQARATSDRSRQLRRQDKATQYSVHKEAY